MKETVKTVSKTILSLVLSAMLILVSLPVSVVSATEPALATVESFTGNPTFDDTDKADIKVQFDSKTELDWHAKDDSIGRPKDGWWIGVKVVAPSGAGGYSVSELKNSKFKLAGFNSDTFSDYNFWDAQDSDSSSDAEDIERYSGIWLYVNESVLNNAISKAKSLESKMEFDWDNDDTYEQKLTISVDPGKIELYKGSGASKTKVYPATGLGSVEALTEAASTAVEGSETNTVSVTNSGNITLSWSQKDASIGRTKDGWWYGVKVTAPTGMGETELKKAKFQFKAHGKTSWTDAGNFWDIRDSGNATKVWVGLWLFVDQAMVDEGKNIVNYARVDWDGDEVYEQLVTITLDPSKVILDYTNLYDMDDAKPAFSDVTDSGTVWVSDRDTYEITGTVTDQGTESGGTTYTSGMDKVEYAAGSKTATRKAATFDKTTNKFKFTISDEFEGDYYVFATDVAGNEQEHKVVVKFDNKNPVLTNVVADATDWTKGKVVISGKATDSLSGIDRVDYSYESTSTKTGSSVTPNTDGTFSIDIPAQEYEGNIVITAYDVAGRSTTQNVAVKMDNAVFLSVSANPSTNVWTKGDVTVTGTFADNTSGLKNIKIKKSTDDDTAFAAISNITFEDAGTRKSGSFAYTITKQDYSGDYLVRFTDRAGNISECTFSPNMDITKPVVEKAEADPSDWTNDDVTISGTVSDNLSGVSAVKYKKDGDTDWTDVTAFDATEKTYSFTISKQNYKGDYIVYCEDNAGNKSDEKKVGVKMDVTRPSDVTIAYSDSVTDKILSAVTFGFYQENVQVTLESKDETVGVDNSGIKSFKYSYIANGPEQTSTTPDVVDAIANEGDDGFNVNGTSATYVFTIPAQFRGTVTASAVDKAGNATAHITADTKNIVVDNISPVLSVEYTSAATPSFYKEKESVNSMAEADTAIYNKDVTATIIIDEANFFENSVGIQLVKTDDNDTTTKTEYLPEGATAKFNDNTSTETITWVNDGISNSFTINYNSDSDYQLIIDYPEDYSKNATSITNQNTIDSAKTGTKTYESKTVTVDKTAPVIEISYADEANDDEYRNADKYFKNRTATVTVVEHNFDKNAFLATITSDSIQSAATETKEDQISTTAKTNLSDKNWVDSGNVHTLTLNYTDDANYTFSFDGLVDYAKNSYAYKTGNTNEFKDGTVAPEDFVCDETPSTDVVISYSQSVVDLLLTVGTFGFYKGKCDVTLTSTDETSGVQYFKYSYDVNDPVNTANVGGAVNTEKTALATVTDTPNKFEHKFTIPAQFRGTVTASAVDNSGNATEKETADDKTIVVDNISPVMSVAYPEAVNTENEYSYYNSDVVVTLDVTDENFMDGEFPNEVRDIKISADIKDEKGTLIKTENYQVNNWARVDNTDKWEGTFTLTDEGYYDLTINYTDKSGNKADKYTRNDINIDKTVPTITKFEFDRELYQEKMADDKKASETILVDDYGYYFNAATNVTVTANDETPAAGVKNITVKFVNHDGTITLPEETKKVDAENKATFEVPAKFKGQIIAKATDFAANTGDYKTPDGTIYETDEPGISFETPTYVKGGAETEIQAPYKLHKLPEDATEDQKNSTYYKNELFNDKAYLPFAIDDEKMGDSGIRKVEWEITAISAPEVLAKGYCLVSNKSKLSIKENEGKNSKLNNAEIDDKSIENNLVHKISGRFKIGDDYNDIIVTITVTDRSGNTKTKNKVLSVDKTAPKISITYADANKETGQFADYYNTDREAIITVHERNFDPKLVEHTIENIDPDYTYEPDIKKAIKKLKNWSREWRKDATNKKHGYAVENPDGTEFVFRFKFEADKGSGNGIFELMFKLEDRIGNKSKEAKDKFTIDATKPVITITYEDAKDSENKKNAGFFKQNRTIVVTIEDHTLDKPTINKKGTVEVFKNLIKVSNNGKKDAKLSQPQLSDFKEIGKDKYQASAVLKDNAHYIINMSIEDKAGNLVTVAKDDKSAQQFDIDKTEPEISFKGIKDVDFASYNDPKIIPVITITDKDGNLDTIVDDKDFVIKVDGVEHKAVTYDYFAPDENIVIKQTKDKNGYEFTLNFLEPKSIDLDDVYRIEIKTIDKAGNEYKITKYISVNRYGSTYDYKLKESKFNEDSFFENVLYIKPFVNAKEPRTLFTEINCDYLKMKNTKLKLVYSNTKQQTEKEMDLVENKHYRVVKPDTRKGDYQIKRYDYQLIDGELFNEDGVYEIFATTKDAAKNKNINTVEVDKAADTKSIIKFVVDNTPPRIDAKSSFERISFEKGNNYKIDTSNQRSQIRDDLFASDGKSCTFKLSLDEENLGLDAIEIADLSVKFDGRNIALKDMDVLTENGVYDVSFVLNAPDNLTKTGDLIVTIKDRAGLSRTLTAERLQITNNGFIRFINNKLALGLTIGAIVAVVGGISAFSIIKRRKERDNDE